MSRAACFPLSQLRTSTSAGRVRLKSGVMPLPDSTLTPRWARWQNSTITLRRWLWRVTTSPPCLQVVAWLPRRSRAKPGHREHEEPLAVSIPSSVSDNSRTSDIFRSILLFDRPILHMCGNDVRALSEPASAGSI